MGFVEFHTSSLSELLDPTVYWKIPDSAKLSFFPHLLISYVVNQGTSFFFFNQACTLRTVYLERLAGQVSVHTMWCSFFVCFLTSLSVSLIGHVFRLCGNLPVACL